ncbi:MAG: hypothetical protein E6Q99_07010 [Elusimicrobia bacterium]|nr:MAG: hypothetical protein E6Q99_07010 [Elusimicrobiota bacterium]
MKLNVFEGARRIALALGALWVVGCLAYAVLAEPYASATFAIPGPGEPPVKAERCAGDDATAYTTTKTSKGHSVGISLCFTAHTVQDGQRLVPYTVAPWEAAQRLLDEVSGRPSEEQQLTPEALDPALREADAKGDTDRARKLATLIQALRMANKHAAWIVANEDKRGSAEFDATAKAYRDARGDVARAMKAASESKALPLWSQVAEVKRPARVWLMNEKYSSEVSKYTRETAERFSVGASDMEHLEKLRSQALFDQWKLALQVLFGGLAFGWMLMVATGWIIRGFLGIPRGKDSRPVT